MSYSACQTGQVYPVGFSHAIHSFSVSQRDLGSACLLVCPSDICPSCHYLVQRDALGSIYAPPPRRLQRQLCGDLLEIVAGHRVHALRFESRRNSAGGQCDRNTDCKTADRRERTDRQMDGRWERAYRQTDSWTNGTHGTILSNGYQGIQERME
jgi:hypothetical protein